MSISLIISYMNAHGVIAYHPPTIPYVDTHWILFREAGHFKLANDGLEARL